MFLERDFSQIQKILFYSDPAFVPYSDRENPPDSPGKILPILVEWSGPNKSPSKSFTSFKDFSSARRAAIEKSAALHEGIYVARGYRWRLLPIIQEVGYIGSSGNIDSVSARIRSSDNNYGLHKFDTNGRIKEMYLGQIRSRLTGKNVATHNNTNLFDYEVAEHMLIAFTCGQLSKLFKLPYNKGNMRKVRNRSAILFNQYKDQKRKPNFPDILFFDVDNPAIIQGWFISQNKGGTFGKFRKIQRKLTS